MGEHVLGVSDFSEYLQNNGVAAGEIGR
jgi:hypothetical protein